MHTGRFPLWLPSLDNMPRCSASQRLSYTTGLSHANKRWGVNQPSLPSRPQSKSFIQFSNSSWIGMRTPTSSPTKQPLDMFCASYASPRRFTLMTTVLSLDYATSLLHCWGVTWRRKGREALSIRRGIYLGANEILRFLSLFLNTNVRLAKGSAILLFKQHIPFSGFSTNVGYVLLACLHHLPSDF